MFTSGSSTIVFATLLFDNAVNIQPTPENETNVLVQFNFVSKLVNKKTSNHGHFYVDIEKVIKIYCKVRAFSFRTNTA